MKRTGICVFAIICLTLLNPLLPQLNAKMSVISPQEMILKSDHIIVGIIKKQDFKEEHREVAISVDVVLKGKINQKEIVLKRDIDAMHIWNTFDFPEEGSKVMVLLRNTSDGYTPTYVNSVCIINNSKVHLYKGMGFGINDVHWLPKDYEQAYQVFYENSVSMRLTETIIQHQNGCRGAAVITL
ncbi:hypothetical protein, partial [Paenibacillus alginolyticus]|uniref:hypothetical protein n=1 Tax=Paenibacillus alginolyticus TaxID=59839 RepID=UPI0013E2CA61